MPFAVQCVSCHGRLRVTDESIVGTIVACPRCGSMVQINEPESDNTPSGSASTPSGSTTTPSGQPTTQATTSPAAAISSAAPASISPNPESPAPAGPPPRPTRMVAGDEEIDSQEMTRDDFSQDDVTPNGPPPFDDPASDSPAAAFAAPEGFAPPKGTEPPVTETPRTAPDPDSTADSNAEVADQLKWLEEPARRSRQRLLIGAISLGTVVILGILAMWLFGGSEPITPVAQTTDPTSSIDPETTPNNTPDSVSLDKIASADSPNDSTLIPTKTSDPDGLPTTPTESLPDSALEKPASQNSPDPNSSTETPTPPTTANAPPPMIPTGLLPIDPLRADDEEKTGDQQVMRDGGDEAAMDPLMGLPPELEAFTQLLDVPGDAPDAPPIQPSDANVEELRVDQAADDMIDPMILATPPHEVNVANALKFRVAIQSDGYPLSDFLLLCSELTQVPMQIDWVTLDLAGVSFAQKIKDNKPGWKPIGDLLKTLAAELKLSLQQEPDELLWTLEAKELSERLTPVLNTSDLGDEEASAQQLIKAFDESIEWEERERIGLAAIITDGIRKARGLPTKLNPVTLNHLMIQAECLDPATRPKDDFPEHWPLIEGGESGNQLDTAITLAGFLRHTARLNGSTCIVNWQDARTRRLSPGQLVMPFAGDPAGTMLRKTLSPLGLSARIASEGIWWVGTDATYDRMPVLVIGDELGPQREAIIQRIETAAKQAGADLLIHHDPVSDRYLSLMPRFLYRQLPTILKPF
ncbi:hypothetical protein [Neorhodopirellula lusitana]|uniref:hypothetical protein n=1 Tax=Neorhodopirellula lusitana TaxID=445327 RepID=UPI00384A4868